MMEYIDISILNPAEYNPRLLTNEAQEDLKKSIKGIRHYQTDHHTSIG